MSEPSVTATGVWKRFRRGQLHDSLRDLLPAIGRRVLRRQPSGASPQKGEFWALRDVSFRVGPGDALGVIGPNGAGKSTLLKVLTGVLRPTAGECHVSGRVGALIEIAAGFHPDLTGRENVFLNGALLGYSRFENTSFATASYSFRSSIDPPNTMRSDRTLYDGLACFYKDYATGRNRWGDYPNGLAQSLPGCFQSL